MLVNPLGKLVKAKFVQFPNASCPILVKLLGKLVNVKLTDFHGFYYDGVLTN